MYVFNLENDNTFFPGDNPVYACGSTVTGGGNTQPSQDGRTGDYYSRNEEERYLDNPIYSADAAALSDTVTPYMILNSSSSIYDTVADDS